MREEEGFQPPFEDRVENLAGAEQLLQGAEKEDSKRFSVLGERVIVRTRERQDRAAGAWSFRT